MAMLAEPRRRKKYNLCPRGKALYEDSARFGTKMLEKMGWSKGRGLGANEDGSQDFVRVRFKNDAEGLGYENRDDQWTVHEEGFNGLLNTLNGGSADDAVSTNENSEEEDIRPMGFGFKEVKEKTVKNKTLKENISGISLEEKSKYSKARVHYKKFTRGKDLSRYSEKDLANIFGKKVAEDIDTPVQPDTPTEEPEQEEEEKPIDPNFAGVHTVSTGLSVNDYFKQKMEAMKNKLKSNSSLMDADKVTSLSKGDGEQANEISVNGAGGYEETDIPQKKKKKSKRVKEAIAEQEEKIIESSLAEETASMQKKKKKSKRAAEPEAEPMSTEDVAPKEKKSKRSAEEDQSELTENKLSQKKKSKRAAEDSGQEQPATETTSIEEGPIKEKKKKTKRASEVEATHLEQRKLTEENDSQEETVPKAKKNKQSKRATEEETVDMEQNKSTEEMPQEHLAKEATPVEETVLKLKKHKKSKRAAEEATVEVAQDTAAKEIKKKSKRGAEADAVESEQLVVESEETSQPKRKKKKKDKQEDVEDIKETTLEAPNCEDEANKKSHKKKKSKKHEIDDVSAESSSSDVDNESDKKYLTYEQLIEKRDSFNICTISSFCAEKFYIFDMKAYKNSTIAQIPGYDVDENIKLNVVQAKYDNIRIVNLWEGKTNKYINDERNTKPKDKHKAAVRAVKRRQVFSGI